MAKTLEIHPAAADDAVEAATWYRRRSRAVAIAFEAEVEAALDRIVDAPLECPPHIHGTRRLLIDRFHCDVVFRVGDDVILVVAIANQRRKPGYWTERLRE